MGEMRKLKIWAAAMISMAMLAGCSPAGNAVQSEGSSEAAQDGESAASGENKENPASGDTPVTLKLNHVQSNTDPVQDAFLELADLVKERSGGSLEIQVYANSELGSNKDNIEQIVNGASLIAVGDTGFLADYVPDIGIMNGPFLYGSYEDLLKLTSSEWYGTMEEALSRQGIKLLAMDWYFGERHIISKKPIHTPDDMKGLKIRVPSNTMWTATMEALGAAPTTIQWNEVYSALDQGVVDAAEAPLATIYTSKLQEAAKNIAMTGHFTGIIGLEMSQSVWDSMSENQQNILAECIDEVGKNYSEGVIASEKEWREKLESEGVVFTDVDREPFKEACVKVYDMFPEWSDGLYETVQEAMK